ncbi:hypothetical protein G6F24_015647 [Rhizopus arrhizus]|nr:hypothetical protein G6F24_015647 [Rhizopus arrhizus]
MARKGLRTAVKTYGRTIRGLRASIAPRVARYARRLRGGDAQPAPRDCHLSTYAEPAEEPPHEVVLSTALVRALHALLPESAVVRVGWDDPQLGCGQGGWPLLAVTGCASGEPGIGDGQHGWEYDGARLLLSVAGAAPSSAWWGLARQAMELALQRGRQAGQIKALEEAERLQQALFQIADLAELLHRRVRRCAGPDPLPVLRRPGG